MASVPSLTFGTLLKRYRRAAGLTQEELAAKAGLSLRGIADLERGVRTQPRKETVQLLAEALQLSPAEQAALEAAARQRAAPLLPTTSERTSSLVGLGRQDSAPLVGRVGEVRQVQRQLVDGPPLLLVVGEPGIGKSRLLQAGVEYAGAEGWAILAGGCHRRSGQEPYAPLVGALERSLQGQTTAQQRQAVQGCTWLVRLLPELADLALLSQPAWTLPAEQERRLMFAAVARYLTNVAGPAGTLLVLDDLHWAGPDALDLLQSLVYAPAERPLRILGAYRDTEVAPDDPLAVMVADLTRAGLTTRIALAPLPPEDATSLLEVLSPEAAGEPLLSQQMLERTGGVPFFLISCVQALQVGQLGHTGERAANAVPWTVAETIRQRIMHLPEAAQEVLGLAGVVGRSAPAEVLLTLASRFGPGEAAAVEALEACCRERLLMEEGEHAYLFTHDLIREVVLAELGGARRVLLHRRVAEALEQRQGSTPPEVLAYHYGRAGEAEKAILYLERMGDAARSRYAYAEAADAYEQAVAQLDTLGQATEAARLRERSGEVLSLLGRYDQALAVLEQAVAAHREANDQEGVLRTLARIGQAHSKRGTNDEGLRRLQQELEQPTTPDRSAGAAACYVALAHLLFGAQLFPETLAAAERAAAMARELGDDQTRLSAQERRAAACGVLGKLSEGHQVLTHEVIPLAEALGEVNTLLRALNNLGAIYSCWGTYHEAQSCLERALQLAERLGNQTDVLFLHYQVGLNAFCLGEWQQAREEYELVAREVRPGVRFWGHTYAFYGLGWLALAQGEAAAASRHFEEARSLEESPDASAVQDMEWALAERDLLAGQSTSAYTRLAPFLSPSNRENVYVKEYLPRLAWAMLELGEDTRAQTLLAELITEAREAQMRPVLIEALRVQALAWIKEHRWAEAERALEDTLALCQSLPHPYAEAKTLSIFGHLHLKRGEHVLARQRLEAALVILGAMGERLYASHIEHMLTQVHDGPGCFST